MNFGRLLQYLVFCLAIQAYPSHAYTIIQDRDAFMSLYGAPASVIGFDNPLPGGLTGVSYSLGGGNEAYEVRAEGWSPLVHVGSLSGGGVWTATTWYGTFVSPTIYEQPDNYYNRIYLASIAPSLVLSLETSNGFYGLIPTGPTDNFFTLPVNVTLDQMTLGYQPATTAADVPEPSGIALLAVGLGMFLVAWSHHGRNASPLD